MPSRVVYRATSRRDRRLGAKADHPAQCRRNRGSSRHSLLPRRPALVCRRKGLETDAGSQSRREAPDPRARLAIEPSMSDVVLSVLAHPDDAEFICAGTLIRLSREKGWQVHIASMTPGDCGSAESPPEEISEVRRAEGAHAAAVVGAAYHCLEERDLLVTYSER